MGNLDLWLLTLNCPLDAVMDSIFGDHFRHSSRVHALGQHSRAAKVRAEALRRPAPAVYLESSRGTFEQVTLGQLRTLLLDATAMEPRPSRPHGGGSLGRQGCPIPILRLRDLVVGGLWCYVLAEGPHDGQKERRGFVARAFPNRGFIAK